MGRRWIVAFEGKEHDVEAKYGDVITDGSGELLVDSQLVGAWRSDISGLPKEKIFEIEGRKAILRRVGIRNHNLDLLVSNANVHRIY